MPVTLRVAKALLLRGVWCLMAALPWKGLPAQIDPGGDWRTLESPHFRVHFRAGIDSTALRAAGEAERAYALLAMELRPPRGTVDLVLSEAADFTNGSATVFPSPRIVILLAAPAATPGLQNYDDWLRLVLTHELTHIFHLDRVRGPWRVAQAIFGRAPGTFPNTYQPSWVTEGIATYYESRLTGYGRVRGSFHSQVMLAAEREGRWPRPNEATFLSEKWPDGIKPYAFGSRFFDRLSRTAFDSIVPRLVERSAGQWIPTRTGYPLRRVADLERDSVWEAMHRTYAFLARERYASAAETIADRLRAEPAPAISPAGVLAYFSARPERAAEIVVRDPQGRESRYLTTAGVDLAWREDTLYATRLDFTDPATFRSDLYRLADGRWSRLTWGERVIEVTADSAGVVGVQLAGATNQLVRYEGNRLLTLDVAEPGFQWASPTLGRQGELAAVEHANGRTYLSTIRPCGNDCVGVAREVESAPGQVLADPRWSPDGQWLLYTSDASGFPQVYRRDDRGESHQVTNEPTGAMQPALSADGWLYFATLEADGYALKRQRWSPDTLLAQPHTAADSVVGAPESEPPASPLPPLDPTAAPTAPFRARGYHPWPALRPHYFVPVVTDRGEAGVFLGAFTSGGDPIGRTVYYATMGVGLSAGRLEGRLGVAHSRWAHHTLDLTASQEWSDAGVVTAPFLARIIDRERDAALGFTTRWRRWRRSLSLRVAAEYQQDRFTSDPPLGFSSPELAGGSATVGLGRFLTTPLGISLEDGAGGFVRYRRLWRLDRRGWSDEYRGRLAGYLAFKGIGSFAHPVLATRVAGAIAAGPDRKSFGVGGVSSSAIALAPGVVTGGTRDHPVRGYPPGELRGTRVLAATAELRIPIALVAKPLGSLPLGLDRISASPFGDFGKVWNPVFASPVSWIASVGVEGVWDVGVSYDVPLRVRTAIAVPLRTSNTTRRGHPALTLGFGADF